MNYRTFKYFGLFIVALLLCIVQLLGWMPDSVARAETRDTKIVWNEVRDGVWIRIVEGAPGLKETTLLYARHADTELFSVTTHCGYIERTFTVSWKRGDDTGVIHHSCTGRRNVDHPIDRLEGLFVNLPGGAPPAKPAEVSVDVYLTKIIV